jgi:hypothetical protein
MQLVVVGPVDPPEAAFTQNLFDAIAADPLWQVRTGTEARGNA